MKKKFQIVAFILCMVLCLSACGNQEDVISSQEANATTVIEEPKSQYVINESSTIASDMDYLGCNINKTINNVVLANICAMFPDDEGMLLYFLMPKDDEYHEYRVANVTIENTKYDLKLIEVSGSYQKYKVNTFPYNDSEQYEITQMFLANEKNPANNQTYEIKQTWTIRQEDNIWTFDQDCQRTITLEGQLIQSIFQFDKNRNCFVTFWNNIVPDADVLDVDKRSFFYFAFKCYDIEREEYFKPEEIMELEVKYTELNKSYEGKDKEQAANIAPTRKERKEVITPDSEEVITSSRRTNYKSYKYNTINDLSTADWSVGVDANAQTLKQAAKQYDWAVLFGNRKGYDYDDIETGYLMWKDYKINITEIEDFKTIRIKYRYEGEKYDIEPNTLIAETTVTVLDDKDKPSIEEKNNYKNKVIMQDNNLTLFQKIVKILHIKSWLFAIIAVVILVVLIKIILQIKQGKDLRSIVKSLKQNKRRDDD